MVLLEARAQSRPSILPLPVRQTPSDAGVYRGRGEPSRMLTRPLRRLRSEYRTLTAPLRGLPSVLIIGAQKGGTTSLFNYLIQHPGVLPPLGKEIHYFDLHYAAGPDWYRARFPYARQLRSGH